MKVNYFFDVELFYQKYSEVFDASSHMNQAVILAKINYYQRNIDEAFYWADFLNTE